MTSEKTNGKKWNFSGYRGGPTRVLSKHVDPSPHTCEVCKVRALCIDSKAEPNYQRRRYKCLKCGTRWSTYEVRKECVTEVQNVIDNSQK